VIDNYNKYFSFIAGSRTRSDGHQERYPLPELPGRRARAQEGNAHCEIEEGAASTVLVHLANISYRLGRTVHFDRRH